MKIREIIQTLFPTRTWKLAAIIAGGVLCGLGSYTLYASRAWTYLSDDPATCVNCHIMGPYYATWNHSSHSRNACLLYTSWKKAYEGSKIIIRKYND